jgi:hypothetical protein
MQGEAARGANLQARVVLASDFLIWLLTGMHTMLVGLLNYSTLLHEHLL